MVGAVQVEAENEIMLITNAGTLVRTRVDEISLVGRNTQGVKLINVQDGEKLIGIEKIESIDDEVDEDSGENATDSDADNGDSDETPLH